jgi:hypothetical protein
MHPSTTCGCEPNACSLGILERPRYFARQLITPAELNLESAYFAERLRRHNRMLVGWGVVCGAQVCRVPSDQGTGAEPWKVRIRPGYAIDGHGNEISIASDRIFDLRSSGLVVMSGDPEGELSDPWCSDVWTDRPPGPVWLAVCHKESLARPVRVQPAGCGCDDTSCEYSRWQDGYELRVLDSCPPSHQGDPPSFEHFRESLSGPLPDCPPCPEDPCVVLAGINLDADGTITAIDNCSCRRMVVSLAPFWWRCRGAAVDIKKVTATENPTAGASVQVAVTGTHLRDDSTVDFGADVKVTKQKADANGKKLTLTVQVASDATPGARTLTITNPDCSFATKADALTIATKT